MSSTYAAHDEPLWRDDANFLILARVSEDDASGIEWEQLWARRVTDTAFVICCIPFFAYGISLGDLVRVDVDEQGRYLVRELAESSGHYTFRVWLGETEHDEHLHSIVDEIRLLAFGVEWHSDSLMAIDAADSEQAEQVANYLMRREQEGSLEYETGRLS